MSKEPFVPSSNVTISLVTAQDRIATWRNYIGPNMDTKAFFLSMSDLAILGDILSEIENPLGVRAYLARNDQNENGLVLVAVSATNSSNESTPNGTDIVSTINNESLICDFTTPCPTMCDVDSPLNDVVSLKK